MADALGVDLVAVDDSAPVVLRLRLALWELASVLPERQRLRDMLMELRGATVGLPSDDPAAELAAKIGRADALHRAKADEVRERIEQLSELAARCRSFHDEQQASTRARHALRRADAVLGTVAATEQRMAEDMGAFIEQVASVPDAYCKLGRDTGSDSVPTPGSK